MQLSYSIRPLTKQSHENITLGILSLATLLELTLFLY